MIDLNELCKLLKEAGMIKESLLISKLKKASDDMGELIYLQEVADNRSMGEYEKQMLTPEGYRSGLEIDEEPIRLNYRDILIMRLDNKLVRYLLDNQDEVSGESVLSTDKRIESLDNKEDGEFEYSEEFIKELLYTDKFYDFFELEDFTK
tara:strand:+ start:6067 stop:6516 length:450 start_codon:yes stop_codon:yes gene_type:complete